MALVYMLCVYAYILVALQCEHMLIRRYVFTQVYIILNVNVGISITRISICFNNTCVNIGFEYIYSIYVYIYIFFEVFTHMCKGFIITCVNLAGQ